MYVYRNIHIRIYIYMFPSSLALALRHLCTSSSWRISESILQNLTARPSNAYPPPALVASSFLSFFFFVFFFFVLTGSDEFDAALSTLPGFFLFSIDIIFLSIGNPICVCVRVCVRV